MSYQYIGEEGAFCVKNPEKTSYLYFPLANENGVKSCVTPDLGGDLKTGQNSFFMAPVSSENLHNDKSTRNSNIIPGIEILTVGCAGSAFSLCCGGYTVVLFCLTTITAGEEEAGGIYGRTALRFFC